MGLLLLQWGGAEDESTSEGRATVAVANGHNRRMSMRWIVLMGLAYWLLVCAYMLLMHGEELDFDSVFPFAGQETGATVSNGATSANPPSAVVAAFWAIGIIIGLPIAFAGQAAVIALRISIVAVGACLLVSILRLGVLLVPVLALQLLAHRRLDMAQHS